MEEKASNKRGKYEQDDDGIYEELERRIAELIVDNNPDDQEVKPSCKLAQNSCSCRVITEERSGRMMVDRKNYYDWSVSGSSKCGGAVFSYYPSSKYFSDSGAGTGTGNGTGVFIPLIAHKFENWAPHK